MSLEDVSVSTVSVVALKLQAATGTPEVLTAADAEIVTTECTILPDHNVTDDRVDTNSDGTETAIPNGQTGKATLTVELGGSGSSANLPAWAVALLPASGWEKNASSNVFTYSPGSDSIITLSKWIDDKKLTLSDARGTFTMTWVPGVPVKMKFDLVGNYQDEEDEANPTPTVPRVLAPIWADGTCSWTVGTGSAYALALSTLAIAAGTSPFMRPDPNAASGYASGCIAGRRNSTFSMDPEMAKLISTKDWHAVQKSAQEGALTAAVGTVANNIVTVAGLRGQVLQAPMGDRTGLAVRNISGRFNGASPFTITFS